MSDNVDSAVLDILAKHAELDRSRVTVETPLKNAGVDSLKLVEIIFDLEEHFDISIPDPDYIQDQSSQFRTASDVIQVVKQLMGKQDKAT